jgi:hypothetical protein
VFCASRSPPSLPLSPCRLSVLRQSRTLESESSEEREVGEIGGIACEQVESLTSHAKPCLARTDLDVWLGMKLRAMTKVGCGVDRRTQVVAKCVVRGASSPSFLYFPVRFKRTFEF